MRFFRFATGSVLALFLPVTASANPNRLDTISYNFQLSGGGGASSAELNLTQNIEIFCVDFANDIFVPHSQYSANLSTLTAGSLSLTRFGENTNWRTVTIADDATDGGSDDAADSAIINAAGSLGRYQMAAYLISLYQVGAGNTAFNNGIQTAIWEILDPSSYSLAPFTADPSEALETAATWYKGTSSAARDLFLANYRVVSDSTMVSCGGGTLCGGFQEQITVVPEPRGGVWLLLAALAGCGFLFRKNAASAKAE